MNKNEVLKDIYPKAFEYCCKKICKKKNHRNIDIYGHDFDDVFHNALEKLLKHLDKLDGPELESRVNPDYFFYTIVNNFKEEMGRLSGKSVDKASLEKNDRHVIDKNTKNEVGYSYLRNIVDNLDNESTAILAELLRNNCTKTELMRKINSETNEYNNIDELEPGKHRYAVRAFIRNKMTISALSTNLSNSELNQLKTQLTKRNPKWKPLKKAIKRSEYFDLDFYLEWKSNEYMNKDTRNSGKKLYEKLENIKEQLQNKGLISFK